MTSPKIKITTPVVRRYLVGIFGDCLELPTWFIKLFSRGDVILDPFIGSGTTALACMQLNRHYIGIEAFEEYYNLALSRIHSKKDVLTQV
ncbi:MAG: DNA methyltransferase [Nitrososphaerales archaeon]